MPGRVLLSTAYLPPIEYIALINDAVSVLIEREENYLKQTYRNRSYILTSGGLLALSVPVCLGSFHKTPVKDIRIDYSKRWQQVHTGAIKAAYSAAPFFIFYFEEIERSILKQHTFLLDLNMELLSLILGMLKMKPELAYTTEFQPVNNLTGDARYSISPKKSTGYSPKKYLHVFNCPDPYPEGLSITDLLFNTGPDAVKYL